MNVLGLEILYSITKLFTIVNNFQVEKLSAMSPLSISS